jgi:hypothetical protein
MYDAAKAAIAASAATSPSASRIGPLAGGREVADIRVGAVSFARRSEFCPVESRPRLGGQRDLVVLASSRAAFLDLEVR